MDSTLSSVHQVLQELNRLIKYEQFRLPVQLLPKPHHTTCQNLEFMAVASLLGQVFFQADTAEHGTELWKSDGTAAGTVMLKDILTGSAGSDAVRAALSHSARPLALTSHVSVLLIVAWGSHTCCARRARKVSSSSTTSCFSRPTTAPTEPSSGRATGRQTAR